MDSSNVIGSEKAIKALQVRKEESTGELRIAAENIAALLDQSEVGSDGPFILPNDEDISPGASELFAENHTPRVINSGQTGRDFHAS